MATTTGPAEDLPVPEEVTRHARGAFDQADRTATLAQEVEDSLLTWHAGRGARRLRFSTGQLDVDVDVQPLLQHLRLNVALSPPCVMTVEVRHAEAAVSGRSDERGQCVLEPVRHGAVSLLLTSGDERTATAWTLL